MAEVTVTYKAAVGGLLNDEEAHRAGEFLSKTFKDQPFTSADVVEVARDPDSPLHKHFDWNVEEAAEKWWRTQAAHIVRSILVIEKRGDKQIESRGFHYVTLSNGHTERRFVNQEVVWRQPDLSQQVVQSALRELRSWKKRYETYVELSEAVSGVQMIIQLLEIEEEENGSQV